MGILRSLWSCVMFIWLVIQYIITGLQIDLLWGWLTGPGQRGYRTALHFTWQRFYFTLLAVPVVCFILFWLNVVWFHCPRLSTIVGLIMVAWTALVWAFHTPIAIVASAVLSVVQQPLHPKRWYNKTLDKVNRYIHIALWIMIGELIVSMYVQIFPLWRNLGVVSLLFSAVLVMLFLSRLVSGEERLMLASRWRGIINSAMLLFVVICTIALGISEPFKALLAWFNESTAVLAQGRWLPLFALMLIAVTLAVLSTKQSQSDGPPATKKWVAPIIIVMYLYTGTILIATAILKWNMPAWTLPAGGVALTLLAVVWGWITPSGEKGARLGRIRGIALYSVITLPFILFFFGWTQLGRYYDSAPNIQVVKDASGAVVQADTLDTPRPLVKICPTCGEVFGGAKTGYNWCDKHLVRPDSTGTRDYSRIRLVWINEAPDSVLTKIEKDGPSSRDVPYWLSHRRSKDKDELSFDEFMKGGY